MSDYGPIMQPCGKAHFVCDDCARVRLQRIVENADKEPMTRIPAADWRRLVELMRDALECEYYEENCDGGPDDPCTTCAIRSIIARTEASNV